ncbi:MAG TPA: hypothetical protein DHV38_01155 [Corynebacterium casei]|uniref:GIY-YIG domain-containing protein n=1 Tax=Corynebacterium casei UCMA 3821 TaxID=1110505 RepID=G7I1S6_9CORY|nr:putative uncharacterized protein [Corynebacterium casei UCMA 3821]HCJ68039.1 hypothetical protein [Corynebacterium casei]
MVLTLGPIMHDAGINYGDALAIRHVFITSHDDTGERGIHIDSTAEEILTYTSSQSAATHKFPHVPPRFWLVFIREGGNQARLWKVVENHGEASNDGIRRIFTLTESERMSDLAGRLVINWRAPRTWRLNGATVANYAVETIAEAEPIPFPGFDNLILSYALLQSVIRDSKYASWRTALSSVKGIYLITDTRSGRHYIGKADGPESIHQRWHSYAANGHGGNKELKALNPDSFRFSLLRIFDPSTPNSIIDSAESHFKLALDTRIHGLNSN